MATLANKIKVYLDREVDFESEVKLQDDQVDGVSNPYIKEWNAPEAQPTEEQLNAVESQTNNIESNIRIDETRRKEYGDWQDQLDEIYHDIDAWKARLLTIKNSNPKS